MSENIKLRLAETTDAAGISSVIEKALRESNSNDYSSSVIERVVQNFHPNSILELLKQRAVFVATLNDCIVGTASLDEATVRTVFVSPQYQRNGIGKRLMALVERAAEKDNISVLSVPSSVTAEHFYKSIGYNSVREAYHGDERTIIMERRLEPTCS